jgi:hypothetical protein
MGWPQRSTGASSAGKVPSRTTSRRRVAQAGPSRAKYNSLGVGSMSSSQLGQAQRLSVRQCPSEAKCDGLQHPSQDVVYVGRIDLERMYGLDEDVTSEACRSELERGWQEHARQSVIRSSARSTRKLRAARTRSTPAPLMRCTSGDADTEEFLARLESEIRAADKSGYANAIFCAWYYDLDDLCLRCAGYSRYRSFQFEP